MSLLEFLSGDDSEGASSVLLALARQQSRENDAHGFLDGDIHPVRMACGALLTRRVPKYGEPITCDLCLSRIRSDRAQRRRMEMEVGP